jgi:nitroreductase
MEVIPMETLKAIETRRSIRAFKPDPIPDSVMNQVLRAASTSPSYTNTQPWEVVVVRGKKKNELAEKLLGLAKVKAPTCPDLPIPKEWPASMDLRSREHGARRLNTLGLARDDSAGRELSRLMNFEFYGASLAVFLFMDRSLGEWSLFDMGLFAQNLILAAHSLGVESCLQASVTNYAPEIKKFLGVAENKKLIICISLGYPDENAVLNTYRSIKQKPDEFTCRYE